jgi:hypothetical protein
MRIFSRTLPQKSKVVYCLTRGYFGFGKYHYLKLIVRNNFIRKALKKDSDLYDFVIFHEGNVSRLDQFAIKWLSGIKDIQFKEVTNYFEIPEGVSLGKANAQGFGYELMCLFQYLKVWSYLAQYDEAVRIDDDCLISKIPKLKNNEIFACASLSSETHEPTNLTLLGHLKQKGFEKYYDHAFPYTNLFVTKIDFWRTPEVVEFLGYISRSPNSLLNRWGDLPVIGVTLKAFANWDASSAIIPEYEYDHLSHNSKIVNGEVVTVKSGRFSLLKTVIARWMKF